jgi:L-fuconolactonase
MSALQSTHERRRSLFGFDPDFLGKHEEPVLDSDLPIVDPHHHLWDHATR